MNVDQWLVDMRTALRAIDYVEEGLREVRNRSKGKYTPEEKQPYHFPSDTDKLFYAIHEGLELSVKSIRAVNESIMDAMAAFLRGDALSRKQYHLIMALDSMNFYEYNVPGMSELLTFTTLKNTNKSAGLSKYDDYEVFSFFCYEDENNSSYIDPGLKPNPSPVTNKDGSMTGKFRPRIGPEIAPENVPWKSLTGEQQSFFCSYLPDVAKRFKR